MNTTDTQTQAAQLVATAALEAEQTTWQNFYDVHESATDEQKAHAKKEALKDAANARRRIREQAARDAKKLLAGDEPQGKRAARSEAKQEAEAAAAEPLSEASQLPVYAIEGKEQAVGTVTEVMAYQTKKHGEKVQVTMLTEGGWTAVFNAPKSILSEVEVGRKVQVTATWTPREQQHIADGANPRGAQFL